MATSLWVLIFLLSTGVLLYQRAALSVWSLSFLTLLILQTFFSTTSWFALIIEWLIFLVIAGVLNLRPLRAQLFTRVILQRFRSHIPVMSETEREAIAAGTVTWEGDLFQGAPDWQKLLSLSVAKLTEEEQAFVDGPVEEVCRMADDWDITHNRADLPPAIWNYLKEQGFFGLIIPKKYGGKEFSASAHSAILVKLYSRSGTLATTVAVPNSLGPAELLLEYGTTEQKQHYLPRLATGEEIPCFALTGPEAGSDAGSIPDTGIICRGEFKGEEIIGIRLNWDKRYITLAPVATVLGLAFKLYDPNHLLGDKEELGITCALIPTTTPGVRIGRRHFPLNAVFQNGPTQGKDVFIPIDWIIGGPKMAGQGWRMLIECLSVGRAITLPSSAMAGTKLASWVTGAYARIRKQFNVPIGYFEGVQEALARIAGNSYIIEAAVKFTLAAIDRGQKPAIPSAIVKYHATERARSTILDAMDVHGGKGICLGPRNYLGRGYETMPINITVEGANILTRNLIIFGQGAIRCHPYALAELEALQEEDAAVQLKKFDQALFGHMGFTLSNILRAFILSVTGGWLVRTPAGPVKRYFQQFSRFSAAFALVADMSMLLLGSDLKRKENLSARLGDVLSMLYLGSATLKHYAQQEYPSADLPIVQWACQTILATLQKQLDGLLRNFPNRWVAAGLRVLIFPLGQCQQEPSDRLSKQVAELLLSANETRTRLGQGIYLTPDPNNQVGLINEALVQILLVEPLERQIQIAVRNKTIHGATLVEQVKMAVASGIVTQEEAEQILVAEAARKAIIAVDDFTTEELARENFAEKTA